MVKQGEGRKRVNGNGRWNEGAWNGKEGKIEKGSGMEKRGNGDGRWKEEGQTERLGDMVPRGSRGEARRLVT